jgi:flavin reductase (DIM6/NTAB) family NADH-FMN oxidoreductase RutF
MPVSADEFRNALRRWASGVSVITTRRERGIRGITVSSFCSLSLDPPLVLICIDRKARMHPLIPAAGAFAVNILAADQQALSDRAAGRSGEQGTWLEGIALHTARTGAPLLRDCLAWLDCLLVDQHEGGDHTIFVGRVEAAGPGRSMGSPLLWCESGYRAIEPAGRSGRGRTVAPRPARPDRKRRGVAARPVRRRKH